MKTFTVTRETQDIDTFKLNYELLVENNSNIYIKACTGLHELHDLLDVTWLNKVLCIVVCVV